MKKSIKVLISLVIALVLALVCKETVFADNAAPSTLTVNSYALSPKPLGLDYNISVKKATNGKFVYCFDVNKAVPTGIVYTKGKEVKDEVIRRIIASGINDKTDNDFYATQSALWIYLYESGYMNDTDNNYIKSIINAINSTTYGNTAIAQDIKTILKEAKALALDPIEPYISIDTDEIEFKLKKGYYVSNEIEIDTNLNASDYLVALKNGPKGYEIEKDGKTEDDDPRNARYVLSVVKGESNGSTAFAVKLFYNRTGELENLSTFENNKVVWATDTMSNSLHQSRTKHYLGFVYLLCDKSEGFDSVPAPEKELSIADLIGMGAFGNVPVELVEVETASAQNEPETKQQTKIIVEKELEEEKDKVINELKNENEVLRQQVVSLCSLSTNKKIKDYGKELEHYGEKTVECETKAD